MKPLKAAVIGYSLEFKKPAKTSRDTLTDHKVYYLVMWEEGSPEIQGIGECAIIPGLSIEDPGSYETQLNLLCSLINETGRADVDFDFDQHPSIEFGLEMAIMDLENGGRREYFEENEFFNSERDIAINGLVWMGPSTDMVEQIDRILSKDFDVVKLKVGALELSEEISVLRYIRSKYNASEVEIRLDANGSFPADQALDIIKKFAEFEIHSIEQPIAAGQAEAMAALIKESPIDIALDEELIGIVSYDEKEALVKSIMPEYLILKPSLLGGFAACEEWMEIADSLHIGYWVTSALESNIGLNAIAQFVSEQDLTAPQGLGTGSLYRNNIPSPLVVEGGFLSYNEDFEWDLSLIESELI